LRSDFIKVWQILSPKERQHFLLVTVLQAFSGLMDMVGVVSIVPFLSVMANPELMQSNTILAELKSWTQFSDDLFLIILGLLSLGMLILNMVVRLGSGWYGQFVSHQIWWSLHNRMFRYYLNQSYLYHLQHSGNALLEKLQVRLNAVVAGFISPFFLLISSFFSSFFVIFLIIWAEPAMTLTLVVIMAVFYRLVYQKIKTRLDFFGKYSPEFSAKSFKLIAEAFGAIKEIKVRRNVGIYLDLFDSMAKLYVDSQVKIHLFSTMPGGIVEVVAFGGILLVSLLMVNSNGGLQQAIPILGMYVLAMRRILPSIQGIYKQITEIRYYQPSLKIIQDDLIAAISSNETLNPPLRQNKTCSVKRKIELKNLSFAYPGLAQKVLDSISLKIPAGSLIGIAGCSGVGKTTLVDLILGLLEPSTGSILLDDQPLNKHTLPGWQACLGYVPQTGFIVDGTIARNIAFGIPETEVDLKKVKEMARIAQLSEFIESELPRQYETMVGERGVRLSGGQRQRLGIARALYHNPKILILDEATSALDGITEEKVMNSINKLSGQKTIILIAHRLTTLQECDTIFLLAEGKLIDQGNYQSLMDNNTIFRRMTRDNRENLE